MRPMRRSAYVGFSVLTLSAATLAGCDEPQRVPGAKDAHVYQSLADCQREQSAEVCKIAYEQSAKDQANAPRFNDRARCEAEWGPGHCGESHQGGGSFFVPLIAGFMLSNALNAHRDCGPGTGRDCGYGAHGVFVGSGGRMYAGGSYVGDAQRDPNGRYAPPRTIPVAEGPGGKLSPGGTTRGGFGRFGLGGGRGS